MSHPDARNHFQRNRQHARRSYADGSVNRGNTGMDPTPKVHHHRSSAPGLLSLFTLAAQLLCSSAVSGSQETSEKTAVSELITPETATTAAEPDWVKKPGPNELVVETPFRMASEDLKPLLQTAVAEAIAKHLSENSAADLASLPEWKTHPTIQLSDAQVQTCVVQTFERTETVSTIEGPRTMVRTTALINIPEPIEKQLLNDARIVIGSARSKQIAVAVSCLWGLIAVLTLTFRLLVLAGRPFTRHRERAGDPG